MKTIDSTGIKNVLILRTDHLGDLLLSTPLLRRLRSALPGRRFVLVSSPANAGALSGWDAIDEELVFDPAWPLSRKLRFICELRRTPWDLCLTLSPRTRSYVLGRLSGAPLRTGIIYPRRVLVRLLGRLWLSHPVYINSRPLIEAGQPVQHEVLQLFRIAGQLGLPEAAPGPLEFPLDPAEAAWAGGWLADNDACDRSVALIGIHGAGKWLSGGWTAENFLALVRTLANLRPDIRVVLTFGPGDTELQATVETALASDPVPGVLLPGQLPVARWAALISHCKVLVTPDTGSLHLAVALGRPVAALYESRNFLHCSSQWAPWQVPHAVVCRESPTATLPRLADETLRLLALSKTEARS